MTVFGWDLPSEPHFVDESAYISQSFFGDLWLEGKRDDPSWLTYAGYDLPPLAKYLVGWSLRAGGYRRPGPDAMRAWYADTSRRFVPPEALTAARWPSVFLGAIGCLAIYALGAIGLDRRAGLAASLLLMANPLYRMHARRAMSDVPAEALILATAAVGLWSWRRLLAGKGSTLAGSGLALGSGVLGGLATLAKLNGALGLFILGAWAGLAVALGPFPGRARAAIVGATLLAGCVSFATFAALNPFLYAHPRGPLDPSLEGVARMDFAGRVGAVARHRAEVSERAKSIFPNDALRSPAEKIRAVAIQGFGRFGPLGPRRSDSTVRYDRAQDWGGWLWLPWVGVGLVAAIARGRAQLRAGEPPTAWAVATQAGVALVVVGGFIPLAWDRYFLSIQPGSALLGAFAAVESFDLARRLPAGHPRPEPAP